MARATTKEDLIQAGNEQSEKLWKLINSMTEKEQITAFKFNSNIGKEAHWKRDKNIRNLLIHLYECTNYY